MQLTDGVGSSGRISADRQHQLAIREEREKKVVREEAATSLAKLIFQRW